mmetsp:Transcript_23630/g.54235  ORF Transcript_23630/g.54235 Transcript_23630/m.54235 type:complete len:215 (-) Transcript_23630:362-1006(-)
MVRPNSATVSVVTDANPKRHGWVENVVPVVVGTHKLQVVCRYLEFHSQRLVGVEPHLFHRAKSFVFGRRFPKIVKRKDHHSLGRSHCARVLDLNTAGNATDNVAANCQIRVFKRCIRQTVTKRPLHVAGGIFVVRQNSFSSSALIGDGMEIRCTASIIGQGIRNWQTGAGTVLSSHQIHQGLPGMGTGQKAQHHCIGELWRVLQESRSSAKVDQ